MQLTIQNLSKTYDNGVKALNDISLTINKGLFGLLGPNGAGKSSLMRTISTLQQPDEGSITIGPLTNGNTIDVLTQADEVRKILGYLPQDFGVYPKIGAEVLLTHLAQLKGIGNAKERKEVVESLLHKTNLYNVRKKDLGGYSGGMRQRFGIAQALLANPKLIIVDEPTAGLDPAERNRFLNLLSELGEEAIVILSTHIVEDVRELCRDMAIINKGSVVYKGHPEEAVETITGQVWRKKVSREELETYKTKYTVISDRMIAGEPVIHVLSEIGLEADGFRPVEPTLEDVYFAKLHEVAILAV
ncbi:ABC transporter ATP-binding protein [Dyadobacter sp. CY312]|uniref:ABC transporter ATP-binding protein n=1 Tax=Dyadobacter sp. CY312 TaxID=2907303 RepID=UPI001F43EDEB|nr:ABC transporter ATP-binding protein [Dyadobacter sp. CY312]MCE7041419.1 ABC transporter ATP-binding protein [Dyadobacter sp. CY312]